jgi:putative heme-binding domain-containing protein
MSKFGKGRMPHIGSELPDERGLKLIHDWIAGPNSARVTSDMKWEELCECLKTPGAALEAARAVGRYELEPGLREKLLKEGAASPQFTIRELFDGYIPQTGERRLGPTPRPQTILAKTGDAERGRDLFFIERLQCITCHKLDGKGNELGPDLAFIGKQRTRAEILESLIEPSRTVDTKFQLFLLSTLDGRSFAGLLMKRDAKEVVLKDSQNKEVHVASADIETLTPGRESIMPTGVLADLTAQQAADLLEFLVSRK